jgi:hypothetical protein
VANNQLSGSIPASWTSVPRRMGGFDVSNNKLTGTLPDSWDLPKLVLLDASGNQLDGGHCGWGSGLERGLQWACVGRWIPGLRRPACTSAAPLGPCPTRAPPVPPRLPPLPPGTLPPALAGLPELVFLDVRNNQLSGTLEDFANAVASQSSRLLRINLNGNDFTGPVPLAFKRSPIFENMTDPILSQ